ncbi:MAG: dipeptide epimerase [Gammaproteobacteria bacterium]|nr:dipeptide epimerase [Gammaproteobacteria bacterium]
MIALQWREQSWELREPFATARDSLTRLPTLHVELQSRGGQRGRAEAAGVDYDGETPASMAAQLTGIAHRLHDGLTTDEVLELLPAGGARNALDCALWDLRAKESGVPAAVRAGLAPLQPVTTAFTIGLGDEAETRRRARDSRAYPLLKLKVDAERTLDILRIVREERPDAQLVLDANQSWTRELLERLVPQLQALRVELIEQPVARGADATLEGFAAAIPLAADESCTDRGSLAPLAGRYQYVNIKLDKCGGLTEALALCEAARGRGLGLMIGNMCGSSLAMAPAFLVAQRCRYVDLDGPLLQRLDTPPAISYEGGRMHPPAPALWG